MSKNLAWHPLKNQALFMLRKTITQGSEKLAGFSRKSWRRASSVDQLCARERETHCQSGSLGKATPSARARGIIALCMWRAGRLPTKTHHVVVVRWWSMHQLWSSWQPESEAPSRTIGLASGVGGVCVQQPCWIRNRSVVPPNGFRTKLPNACATRAPAGSGARRLQDTDRRSSSICLMSDLGRARAPTASPLTSIWDNLLSFGTARAGHAALLCLWRVCAPGMYIFLCVLTDREVENANARTRFYYGCLLISALSWPTAFIVFASDAGWFIEKSSLTLIPQSIISKVFLTCF